MPSDSVEPDIQKKIAASQNKIKTNKNRIKAATKLQAVGRGKITRDKKPPPPDKAAQEPATKRPNAEAITKLLKQQAVAESAGLAVEKILDNKGVVIAINKAFDDLNDDETESLKRFKTTMKNAQEQATQPPPAGDESPSRADGKASPRAGANANAELPEKDLPAGANANAELPEKDLPAGANANAELPEKDLPASLNVDPNAPPGDGKVPTGGRRSRRSRKARRTRKIRTMNYYRKRGKTKQRKTY